MINISSKVIGTDIILHNDYCEYNNNTDEVIIDLNRLKELMEDMYSFGQLGCLNFDSVEYGGKE